MKTNDKEFPLLIEQGKKDVSGRKPLLFATGISLILLIIGLFVLFYANSYTPGVILIFIGGLFLIIFGVFFLMLPSVKVYDKLVEFAKTGNIDEILKIAKKDGTYVKLAIYALLDLEEFEEAENIVDDIDLDPTTNYRYVDFSGKGTNHLRALIKVTKEKSEESYSEPISIKNTSKRKISKVFFFEKLPEATKCMISSIELDIDKHAILACPSCEGMAKEDLFIKWLEENNKCPVCKRELAGDDLVFVKLK